jgi:gamma-glutamylcyclotransferase (GGCT)/AIG2-like uncharacterized protein YtfP
MCDHLFVYGSLKRRFDLPAARFLREHSRFVGMAVVPGRLYDLGAYPGLVYDASERRRVRGEIVRLLDPERIWPYLDAYEGYDSAAPDEGEYRRALLPALTDDGAFVPCWMYLYRLNTRGLPMIHVQEY